MISPLLPDAPRGNTSPPLSARDEKHPHMAAVEAAVEQAAQRSKLPDSVLAALIVSMQDTFAQSAAPDPFADSAGATISRSGSGATASTMPPSYHSE